MSLGGDVKMSVLSPKPLDTKVVGDVKDPTPVPGVVVYVVHFTFQGGWSWDLKWTDSIS